MEPERIANNDNDKADSIEDIAPKSKRIRRACDRCSRLRVRCDGTANCQRCTVSGRPCIYGREVKRRGPKPNANRNKKDLPSVNGDGDNGQATHDASQATNGADTVNGADEAASDGHSTANASPPSNSVNGHAESNYAYPTASHFAPPAWSPQQAAAVPVTHSPPVATVQSESALGSAATASSQDRRASRPAFYPCLQPILPLLDGIVSGPTACDLLDHYFVKPNASLFTSASPYVLTPVLRRPCLLHETRPRDTSPTLLLTILWVCAHTAQLPILFVPRQRRLVCDKLWELVQPRVCTDEDDHEKDSTDLLLALVLFTIVCSGQDYKSDSLKWWHRAVERAKAMNLHQIDGRDRPLATETKVPRYGCAHAAADLEHREERRRLFWLLFALDRHWALSFNSMPLMMEQDCKVFVPEPEWAWDAKQYTFMREESYCIYGPPQFIDGQGFFQFFVPLMAILGDIIWLHYQYSHPRLASMLQVGCTQQTANLLSSCMQTIQAWPDLPQSPDMYWDMAATMPPAISPATSTFPASTPCASAPDRTLPVVKLYAKFIIHVLHILLYGRWDALDMLSPDTHTTRDPIETPSATENPVCCALSDWITSQHFGTCCSHAIAASDTISQILRADPELAYMPYLFGIYLLHGSFLLLFFAHRMPQVDGRPNQSVEEACETIIRAHEVCVATLSVEFQKDFRKVLRRTLQDVRQGRTSHAAHRIGEYSSRHAPHANEEGYFRQLGEADMEISRSVLHLYRWTRGHRGLAI